MFTWVNSLSPLHINKNKSRVSLNSYNMKAKDKANSTFFKSLSAQKRAYIKAIITKKKDPTKHSRICACGISGSFFIENATLPLTKNPSFITKKRYIPSYQQYLLLHWEGAMINSEPGTGTTWVSKLFSSTKPGIYEGPICITYIKSKKEISLGR